GLKYSEVESDKDVPGIYVGVPDEGHAIPNPGEQDEGQAGLNLGEKDKVQAGPNPGDAVVSQPQSSPIIYDGSNLEHMDLEAINVSTQPHPKQMDEGFTVTAYPKSRFSERTLATTSNENQNYNNNNNTTTAHPPPPQPQQSTMDSMLMNRIGELEHIMANLIQDNKHLEERAPKRSVEAHKKKKKSRDSLNTPPGSPPHQPPPPPPLAGPSRTSRSPGAFGSSQVPPQPPSPPSTNQESQSHGSTAPSSSKTDALAEYKAWTMNDTRLKLSVSSTPKDLQMDDDMAPDAQAHSSDDEDIRNA
nr:hypothetical protein [Tanacetum cinerariifolium]